MGDHVQAKFLTGSTLGHVISMSMTASLGLMAIFLVDFADMVFISMLGKAELAAAVGYAGAVLFFSTSFGIGMAIAAGALVARALGADDKELARRQAVSALTIGVGLSVLLAGVVFWFLGPITALVGASGETQKLAVSYLQIIIPTLPFLMFGIMGSAILRAYGDARRSMLASVGGGVINAVLDPILIFGLGMGLSGAALASVASRLVFAYMAMRPLIREHQALAPFAPRWLGHDAGPIFKLALPAVMTQFATPVGSAYVTWSMAEFGEAAVAGMAMVGRLTPVAFAVVFALSGAIGPIIGQNFGAGKGDRVRSALRDGLGFTAVYVLGVAVVLFLLRGVFVSMFGAEGVAKDLVFLFCGPLALAFFFNGAIFVGNAAFNNMGHPFWSTGINWGRQTLGTVPFVAVGASLWGAQGVLIGQAAGGVVFGLIAVALALWLVRADKTPDAAKAPPPRSRFRQALFYYLHR